VEKVQKKMSPAPMQKKKLSSSDTAPMSKRLQPGSQKKAEPTLMQSVQHAPVPAPFFSLCRRKPVREGVETFLLHYGTFTCRAVKVSKKGNKVSKRRETGNFCHD
jgi:hypothetical protein